MPWKIAKRTVSNKVDMDILFKVQNVNKCNTLHKD